MDARLRQSFAANRVNRRLRGTNPSHTTASLPAPQHPSEHSRPLLAATPVQDVVRPQITEQQARLRSRIQRRLETAQPSQHSIHAVPIALRQRHLTRPLSPVHGRLQRRRRRPDALRVDPYFIPRGPEITNSIHQPRPHKRRRHNAPLRIHDEPPQAPHLNRHTPAHEGLPQDDLNGNHPKHVIRVFDENGIDRTAEYRHPTVSAGFLKSDIVPSPNSGMSLPSNPRHHEHSLHPGGCFRPSGQHMKTDALSIVPSDLDSLRHQSRRRRPRASSPLGSNRDKFHTTPIPMQIADSQSLNIDADFAGLHELRRNLPTLSEDPLPTVRKQSSTRPASTMFDMTEKEPLPKRRRTFSPVRATSSTRFLPQPCARQVSFPPVEVYPEPTLQQSPRLNACESSKRQITVLTLLPWDPDAVSSEILDFESSLIDKPDHSVPQFVKGKRRPLSEIKSKAAPPSAPAIAIQSLSGVAHHRGKENIPPQVVQARPQGASMELDTENHLQVQVAVELPSLRGNPIAQASER